MKIDNKTLAYILIAAGGVVAFYFYNKKKTDAAAAGALGAGTADTRGEWAADDDKTYVSMRNAIIASKDKYNGEAAMAWIDPLVADSYAAGAAFHNMDGPGGPASKSGSLLSVFEGVNGNPGGQFMEAGYKVLFPPPLHDKIWHQFYALKVKYGGL